MSESCERERDGQRGETTPWEMGALWPGGRGLLSKVTLNGEWELLPFANPLPAPVEPEDGVCWSFEDVELSFVEEQSS